MKVECLKEKLMKAALTVSRLVGKNMSLPILSAILMEAKNDSLLLRATNLDIGAEFVVNAKIKEGGSIAVPAQLLVNFLSNSSGENIEIEAVNGNLVIGTGRNKATIKGFATDDYPTLPKNEDGVETKISAGVVATGIKSVVYAASLSEMKPEISSVYIYKDAEELVFVATDSFRLAEKRVVVGRGQEFSKVLIPQRNAMEMARLLEENSSQQVTLNTSKNQLGIIGENFYAVSRLVEGVFPDYQQIMPKAKTTEVVVLKEDFLGALKVASLFTDKFLQIKLKIDPVTALFSVHAEGEATGVQDTSLDATLEGEAIEMSFNARYVLDAFNSLTEDSITLAFNGKGRPMIIKGIGNASFTYLAMPLNR